MRWSCCVAYSDASWRIGSPRASNVECHRASARLLPKHNPPATTRRGKCPQRRLSPNSDLPSTSRAAQLFDAVGVHRRPGPPIPQIPTARAQRVRSLDPDIACVERERITTFDTVPLEGLQEELRHGCIAVIRVEYIN